MDKRGERLFARIAAAAVTKQFGLVTRTQLIESGMNPRRVDRLLAKGRLEVLLPQVFAFPGSYKARLRVFAAAVLWYGQADRRTTATPDESEEIDPREPEKQPAEDDLARWLSPEQATPEQIEAAVETGTDRPEEEEEAPARSSVKLSEPARHAALSHHSAAEIWELQSIPHDAKAHVLREGRKCQPAHDSLEPHGTDSLPKEDVVVRTDGLRLTSVLRTIVDLAACVTDHELELAILDAVARELVTADELKARVEVERKRKVPGLATLEFVLQRAGFDVVTESPLEREVLQVLLDGGLRPEGQHKLLRLPGDLFVGKYDLVFKAEKVLIEVDSKKWHRAWKNKVRDREKTDGAVALGYEVVRVRKRDLFEHHRGAFLRRVGDALATAPVRAAMQWPSSRLKGVNRGNKQSAAA